MSTNVLDMFLFMIQHRLFAFHMILIGILNTLGQIFIYRMVNDFKQHFVPFVLTSRKILTVVLSIIFYHHQTNFWQISGVFIVFAVVTYEFIT
jgi:drug/metabolite transporter (DMT)-like permease